MKPLLAIAYHFPPEGSAGTYRSLRFVRHLPDHGWLPTVLTAEPALHERHDPDLLRLVPPGIDIIRVPARDPWQTVQATREGRARTRLSEATPDASQRMRAKHGAPVRSFLRRCVRTIEAHHYQPDEAKPWVKPATHAAVNACRRFRPQVIWATAGPVSAWVVARRVSERVGVPYVLDLRDPWGLVHCDPELGASKRLQQNLRRTMREAFEGAREVVFLTASAAAAYSTLLPGAIDPSRVHIIPNGFDGPIETTVPEAGSRCTVLYAGTIKSYRYDSLLLALQVLKRTDRERASLLRFRFVGEGTNDLADEAAALGVLDMIETSSPLPLSEVTRAEREAHALLVLGRPSAVGAHELFASAKVFGYLRARRPVAAVLPHDETRAVLANVGGSSVADVDSVDEIVFMLRNLVDAWRADTLASLLPDRAMCDAYSAERQTAALARCLDGTSPLLSPPPSGNGGVGRYPPGRASQRPVGCSQADSHLD